MTRPTSVPASQSAPPPSITPPPPPPSTSAPRATLDLAGELPAGTWVLEASAGTGKTYAIAGLVTRYVAEGVATIDQVLAVTFGRVATSELRNRVRERLVFVRDALADPEAARDQEDDAVLKHLATGTPYEVSMRRQRLATALADFDAATVATVHEFCQQVLVGAGIAADFDPGTRLVEDLDDVRDQVAEDLYLRWVLSTDGNPGAFPVDRARAVAAATINDRTARLLPPLHGLERTHPAAIRVRYAEAVRREFDRRTRGARVVGFDDLLGRVRDALVDPVSGAVAAQRLRARYRVVLVDEFQDTDPVQWDVLRLAFHGHRTLIVIGDPKQAIYAFRGADVRAYLSALDSATDQATLIRNWRSDARLVKGLTRLFRGAALGDPRISVADVEVGRRGRLLDTHDDAPAVELRQLLRDDLPLNQRDLIASDRARAEVADDVAAQVRSILAAGWSVTPRGSTTPRPVHAGDIAVLVRKLVHATLVRDRLQDNGIPVVLTGAESVYATGAAADWITVLEGLEQPNRNARVRAAALTPLIGATATEVDERGPAGTDDLRTALRRWAAVLAERGVAAMFDTLAREQAVAARLLGRTDGERLLTDLRHVAEALHDRATRERLGLGGLLAWLRERVADAAGDPDQERARRLDTDADAVQVTTIHTSKGLEFPIVLVPFGWDGIFVGERERTPRGHAADGTRTLHVGGETAADYVAACGAEDEDEAGEELRLLYVAATRAISRLVLWWAPTTLTKSAPLHRLLFADAPDQGIPAVVAVGRDEAVSARLGALAGDDGSVMVTSFTAGSCGAVPAPAVLTGAPPTLAAAVLGRDLDQRWRRTSYSGLTRSVHEQAGLAGQEPQVGVKDDEGPEDRPESAGLGANAHYDGSERAGLGANRHFETPESSGMGANRHLGAPDPAAPAAGSVPPADPHPPTTAPAGETGGGPEDRPVDVPAAGAVPASVPLPPATAPGVPSDAAQDPQPPGIPTAADGDPDAALLGVDSPMAELPVGAEFGTLVHAILERADLTGDAPVDALAAAAREELRWRHRDLDATELAAALLPATRTSWGPIADGACLADFGPADRLTELDFELPLAGGDRTGLTGSAPVVADLADLLERHLPAGDPVRPYAQMMRAPGFGEEALLGYLTGSIDLIVRVGASAPPPRIVDHRNSTGLSGDSDQKPPAVPMINTEGERYVVVDHKTNRLGPPEARLTAWHYRRTALDEAVRQAHYPLQAMLYSVALHRFLRWRLPSYDPATHLGGVAYLFLRGMCGDDVPIGADGSVPGVWAWRPPASLVVALSAALAGTRS